MTSRAATIPACLTLLALTLTACGSTKPAADGKAATPAPSASKDTTQEFRDWADNGGSDTLDTILTDLAAVQEASNPADLDALRKSCPTTMTANLEVANRGDTMPGPAGQRWTLALDHLAASAAACSEAPSAETRQHST
ncbi:hypothetical protein ABZY06_28585 [Streptomyces sp. NPDC006540]|uniref:hypothetical protein n=1 Tax=Streptomyces sp. NPDC006540 TaxID=3155353 RepID=UPI0033AD471A